MDAPKMRIAPDNSNVKWSEMTDPLKVYERIGYYLLLSEISDTANDYYKGMVKSGLKRAKELHGPVQS
jgi:hypothetical protein